MQVIRVENQKKHLVKVVFDTGDELLIDKDTAQENCIKQGVETDYETAAKLLYDSEYRRAKSRAVWYLDRSDATEKGMFDKLVTAGFDKKASAQVIARLAEVGLIDDRRFAENYAGRCKDANISKREAVRKMLAKGVPYDIASLAVQESDADENDQIKNLIDRKYRRKLEAERGTEKVYAALIRKGFSFSAVRNALKEYSEELENSEENYV